jgi:hypothetical protein
VKALPHGFSNWIVSSQVSFLISYGNPGEYLQNIVQSVMSGNFPAALSKVEKLTGGGGADIERGSQGSHTQTDSNSTLLTYISSCLFKKTRKKKNKYFM